MNITKYIKHFDILTYLHVLGITRSGGHTLIPGNFRYISANFRSETGSEMLFDQSSMWTEWPPPPCGLSARPLHVGGVPAPSMWTECPPPPCGLRLRAAVRGTWDLAGENWSPPPDLWRHLKRNFHLPIVRSTMHRARRWASLYSSSIHTLPYFRRGFYSQSNYQSRKPLCGIRLSRLSLLRKACFRNQPIKINVVVTQAIFNFLSYGIISGGKMPWNAQCIQD